MCFVVVLGLRQVMYQVKGENHTLWRLITCDIYLVPFFWEGGTQQPPMGQGLLIHEVFKSHTTMHHSR